MASHDTWQVVAARPGRPTQPFRPHLRPARGRPVVGRPVVGRWVVGRWVVAGPSASDRQSAGLNVAKAVSRSLVHSAPSHSLSSQLIMME